MNTLTTKMADAIRILSIDAVEKANSGHPGAPMGMAEMGLVLWRKHLNHSPLNPKWNNRDRFVLSNGHASMFIYSLLHLTGYESVSIDDIKAFRQLHSKTPGHPENFVTQGIETTTGPLGQGLANAVGMALAEKILAKEFNKKGLKIVDHNTYCVVGDGCLMEGISHEVCSLAGTLKLSKLIVMYDDNDISIDGNVKPWFSEDVKKRFKAYGWNVIGQIDGSNINKIDKALKKAKKSDKPTLVICKTVIGQGAPNKAGGHGIHGAALGADEIKATRKNLKWKLPPFEIPSKLKNAWDCKKIGKKKENSWNKLFAKYKSAYPKLAKEFERRMNDKLPNDICKNMDKALEELKLEKVATRKASQNALDLIAPYIPELFGGSADLTGSNLTNSCVSKKIDANNMIGNYLSYGVREFGMTAIMNGMKLHSGFVPYGGTFLTFCDYSRNAIRMSALMKEKVIHVFTHDSIGLGEDGPTHQSVEHIPSLRIIPNLDVWRPADSLESFVAWKYAIFNDGTPSALIFSRQAVPVLADDKKLALVIEKGGYVLKEDDNYDIILIGTGTELSLAVEAKEQLNKDGIKVRVVSMPSTNVYDKQSEEYKKTTLPKGKPVVVVEAAKSDMWFKYIRSDGAVVGMDTYGESAPAGELYKLFNITTENVVKTAKKVLNA